MANTDIPACAYGIGRTMAEEPDIMKLKRLYNSGMMPMPMKKDGTYDFETSEFIKRRIMRGY